MKAISLWNPWAYAMAVGHKRNETRHWKTSHRGELVICASKKKLDEVAYSVARMHGYLKDFTAVEDEMKFGMAICVVDLLDVVRTEHFTFKTETSESPMLINEREYSLGNYGPGRFAWVTANLRRLKNPVPVIGRQALWNLPDEVEALIRAQL